MERLEVEDEDEPVTGLGVVHGELDALLLYQVRGLVPQASGVGQDDIVAKQCDVGRYQISRCPRYFTYNRHSPLCDFVHECALPRIGRSHYGNLEPLPNDLAHLSLPYVLSDLLAESGCLHPQVDEHPRLNVVRFVSFEVDVGLCVGQHPDQLSSEGLVKLGVPALQLLHREPQLLLGLSIDEVGQPLGPDQVQFFVGEGSARELALPLSKKTCSYWLSLSESGELA